MCVINMLKLHGTMLFGKSSMHIGMKVSNCCSIVALVSLYPSCYPWRNSYFGKKCCVVVMWFCIDWQCSDASIFALAAKFHLEPQHVVRSSITCINDGFWFYFSKLVMSVLCLFVSFCVFYRVCFNFYCSCCIRAY